MRGFCGNVLTFATKLHNTEQMKRMFRMLGVLLSATALLTSCLGDSDEATVYSDTAITEVTLGTLNRYTQGTSAMTGNDTIVKSTLTGSNYKMTIDQVAHTIYNRDSLPVGTDVAHVVLSTLSTKNSGVALIKSLTSDSLAYVSTTDSIDFTQPRQLRVFSTDGTAYRDYTMTLAVSKSIGTDFGWQKVAERDELKGWADKHLVAFADTVLLEDINTISVNNPYMGGDALLRLGANGYLELNSSPDNDNAWIEQVRYDGYKPDVKMLIGATATELFAIASDGRLTVSTDGLGMYWRDEQLDDDMQLLPTASIAMTSWSYAPADSTDYVLLAGNCEADTTNAVLWRKLSRYHAVGQPAEGQWVYMPIDFDNHYTLPRQEALSIACYNGIVLAVGSDMTMLQSRDQGITWKTATTYALPSALKGTRVAMTADAKGRLWLVTNAGEVWMGTLR